MVLCSVHCSDCREGGRQELVVLMVPVVLMVVLMVLMVVVLVVLMLMVVLVEVGGGFRPVL